MTPEKAKAFRLPDGRILGETTPDDWHAHYQTQMEVLEVIEAKDWEAISPEEQARCEAICERPREFANAVAVVLDQLRG